MFHISPPYKPHRQCVFSRIKIKNMGTLLPSSKHIFFAVCFLSLSVFSCIPSIALAQTPETPKQAEKVQEGSFTFAHVQHIAKKLAQKKYEQPTHILAKSLQKLTAEEKASIKHQEHMYLWKNDNLPFVVELLPPGFLLHDSMHISIIEQGQSTPLTVQRQLFTAKNDTILHVLPEEFEAGGFKILFPLEKPETFQDIASFIGATFFRGFGRQAQGGVFARGVTLNTALQEGEEFPSFTHVWLVKPLPQAQSITLYALMESPSMTGAFSLHITPGTSTVMDVKSVLFPRVETNTLRKIGIAPLASMFYFSTSHGNPEKKDHQQAHSSDGFLYTDKQQKWHWRPLSNPERLNITLVTDADPQGFGLIQRNTHAASYPHTEAHFERRSSLWVEPQGAWGPGKLELIEIPTRSDKHNNIALFWVPQNIYQNATSPEQPHDQFNTDPIELTYNYKLYWMSAGVSPHILGKVTSTQELRHDDDENLCSFQIDFTGESLKEIPSEMGLTSVLELPKNVELVSKRLEKNTSTGGWSLGFTVRLPEPESIVQTLIPARTPKIMHFKAHLTRGENLPHAITEVWHYDMMQQ